MGDYVWRAQTPADAEALTALIAAAERVDDTGEHFSLADVQEEYADPAYDPARDSFAAVAGDTLVAAGRVIAPAEVWDEHLVGCPGYVHPEHRGRGLGTELVRRQVARAAELHLERHPRVPGRVSVGVAAHLDAAAALMAAEGMTVRREFFDMTRELAAELPPPAGPAAPLRIVPYDAARDDEVRRAHNETFRGHYGSTERDPQSWQQWFTGNRNFRPELSLLALAGPEPDAELAGYCLTYFYEADEAATGRRRAWIGQLGTRPAFRGRGLGSALLGAALVAHRAAGFAASGLDVDSENGSGALGLYLRHGFAIDKRWASWERDLPGPQAG